MKTEETLAKADVTLPTILSSFSPQPPADAPANTPRSSVELLVVIGADGQIQEAIPAEPQGDSYDEVALNAVREWTFEPATKDGTPTASRIRIQLVFAEVASTTNEEPKGASVATPETTPEDTLETTPQGVDAHEHDDDPHLVVTVHGERPQRTERRAATDFFIHREFLQAAPRKDGADALKSVPGLVMGRGEGLALAHSYTLRGFHAEHGQDIEFSVGGLPINQPSHVHGQGYADLNFLIGPVVDEVSVSEGVSDPEQGAFAVAGSIDIGLGVDEEHRGLSLISSFGSFGSYRETLVWAPKEAERESVGAVQFLHTSGYGERRESQLGSALFQHRFGEGPVRFRAIGLLHTATGQHPGLVRAQDVDDGIVCYRCAYADPSANAQSVTTQRLMAGIFADYQGNKHASGSVGFWIGSDHFISRSNLTGYSLGLTSDNGEPASDLSEQRNDTQSMGLMGRYRTEAFDMGEEVHGTLEVGSDGRLDLVGQTKTLVDAPSANDEWDLYLNGGATQTQISMWGDVDLQIGDRLGVRTGARATMMNYAWRDGEDPLASSADPALRHEHAATALFVGPRASVEYRTSPTLSLLGSYGHGYRPPPVRSLKVDEEANFSVVRTGDLGFRFRNRKSATLTGAFYLAAVSQDLTFDPHAGGLVEAGASRRAGGLLSASLQPLPSFLIAASVNYVDARVTSEPESDEDDDEVEHAGHGGEPGERIPGVAPLSMNFNAKWSRPLLEVGTHPLVGVLASGLTYASPKPLGEGYWGDASALLDASVGVIWGPVEVELAGYNLLNFNYATEEYLSSSTWEPSGDSPPIEGPHLAAGAPPSFMATLGFTL